MNTASIRAMQETVYAAMLASETMVRQAADQHMIAFTLQMQEKVGAARVILEEPYLEATLAQFRLQYLQTLERLSGVFTSQLTRDKKDCKPYYDYAIKALNPDAPIRPQVEARLEIESVRLSRRLKQDLDGKRQQAFGIRKYIWRSRDDARVRSSHVAQDDRVFSWADPPSTGHPGHEFGCRCWAEPILEDAGEPQFEEVEVAALGNILKLIGQIIARTGNKVKKLPKVKLNNTKTWPKPPAKSKLKEGSPSRKKPRLRGEKSLFDEEGGEWRYDPGDKFHNPHWNYKPPGNNREWRNIPIGDLPYLK